MAPSMAPASAALRVIGPTWSRLSASGSTPWRLTRPQVGLMPVSPLAPHGKRIDPPVSVPMLPWHSPAAVATPDPLDEEPTQWSACQGFCGTGSDGWCTENAPSVMCSLPSITAPASNSLRTTVASSSGTLSFRIALPQVVRTPAVLHRSLMPMGMPCIGPRNSPRSISASATRAWASATSGVGVR